MLAPVITIIQLRNKLTTLFVKPIAKGKDDIQVAPKAIYITF